MVDIYSNSSRAVCIFECEARLLKEDLADLQQETELITLKKKQKLLEH